MRPRMILCSALGRGHMTPMTGLTRNLAQTGEVSITLVFQNKGALDSIQKEEIFTGLDVEFAVLNEAELNFDRPWMDSPLRLRGKALAPSSTRLPQMDFPEEEAALEALLRRIAASPSPPVCIVGDFTLPWIAAPARKLNLPRYVLYTDSASFMALAYHAEALVKDQMLPIENPEEKKQKKIMVPGVPPLCCEDISQYVWDENEVYFPMQNLRHRRILESDGVLLNTFYDLESPAVDALRVEILATKGLSSDSIFAVGPVVLSVPEKSRRCAVFGSAEERCIDWLDSKPECSVLFISFGSWEYLADDQVRELAAGLECSAYSFLWVIVLPLQSRLEDLLPEGFISRVIESGRGLILTSWAPQHMILEHPAIGGFLTHCGWNSVLESIRLAGVPLICWPFLADQPTNCRFVVDGARIGVEVQGDEQGFVSREEIKQAVETIMTGSRAVEMRYAARELKRSARAALASGSGSSAKDLHEFISNAVARPTAINADQVP